MIEFDIFKIEITLEATTAVVGIILELNPLILIFSTHYMTFSKKLYE